MIFDKLYKREIDVLNLVDKSIKSKNGLALTYMNPHCFNVYNSNPEYKKLLDNKTEVFLDGIGIYFALRCLGYKNVQKFNATDLNEKIFYLFSKEGIRLYLIGGKFDEQFVNIKSSQRKIIFVGYQNGFFSKKDVPLIFEEIRNSIPEVIVIGMGVPEQEVFANILAEEFKNKLIICVGNFLEFYFGTKKRAPEVIRNSGLEWFFRLITEPARLWKRYLIGIPLFFYNVLKMKLNSK